MWWSVSTMLFIRVIVSKTYMDYGLFNVPQKERFALEMVNLVVMFVTFILNISLCFTVPWENQNSLECGLEPRNGGCEWEVVDREQSNLPAAIGGSSIGQALVLALIMVNSIHYWTRGGYTPVAIHEPAEG